MTPREWIISHRCSWITVYVFCRNAQSEPHSDPCDVCTLSLLYNCPTIICLPSMLLFILWRDTTSELWTPVQFPLHSFTVLLYSLCLLSCITIILLPLDTLNPLCIANWYVSNVSIIFDAPCLFLHHLLSVLLHFVAFLCIFWNYPINKMSQC
jgi:hypothetical protein